MKRMSQLTEEQKQQLREARHEAYRGAHLIIGAYSKCGKEAIRDALSAIAESIPEDVYGGYSD